MRSIRQRLARVEDQLFPPEPKVFRILYKNYATGSIHDGGWVIFGDLNQLEIKEAPYDDQTGASEQCSSIT